MTLLSAPAEASLPRQAERGARHRAPGPDGTPRVATDDERRHPGRHAAPEEPSLPDAHAVAGEDPLAWLGFRFEVG